MIVETQMVKQVKNISRTDHLAELLFDDKGDNFVYGNTFSFTIWWIWKAFNDVVS